LINNYRYFLLKSILCRGGRYLEAMIQGSKQEAEEGTLVIMAAGDRSLYDDSQNIFNNIAKKSYYLGKLIICEIISLQIKYFRYEVVVKSMFMLFR